MKYSRDPARQILENPTKFDSVIEKQIANIASTGATHVAIATPYDEEFIPVLKMWVTSARKHNLKVWFRGNFSGWEGWFDYERIDRETHFAMTKKFIENNPDLFESGDLFVSCPECENGGPGDPRMNGDLVGHRTFLIKEYEMTKKAFENLGVSVALNYFSMNGDVAELVMDRETTNALDGVVTIDHYVKDPEKLIADIQRMHEKSGGMILLGEYGVPIPDIHGPMSNEEQALWIRKSLELLAQENAVIGINYWVNHGGSTRIWTERYEPLPAVSELAKVFKPNTFMGHVVRPSGRPIDTVFVITPYTQAVTTKGSFQIPVLKDEPITFEKMGYENTIVTFDGSTSSQKIILKPEKSSFTDMVWDLGYWINPFN